MNANRRTVMKGIAAAGATAGATSASTAAEPDAKLIHHVFFWLKTPASKADRDALIAGLRTLRAIPVIRSLHIGIPAPTEQRDVVDKSWDVSELMMFANAADQKAYQDHAVHQAFIAKCAHLWRKVVVYDAIAA